MSDYVPTIDDIRHKICYICRDEETFDNPETPPRKWTHPCKCTLIAHEDCLLKWIKTAESNKGISEALKCAQCGSKYHLERNNPFILRLLDLGNQQFQTMGYAFSWFAAGATVLSVTSFAVWMLAKYGAYAVREFFGEEMYNLLLTDNPDNWPYSAFIQLPLVPVGLILSRFNFTTELLPVVPVMVDIITSPSWVISRQAMNPNKINVVDPPKWPPSPVLFTTIILPFTRLLYGRLYKRVKRWLLGDNPPVVRVRPGEGRLIIRVAALVGGDDDDEEEDEQVHEEEHAGDAGDAAPGEDGQPNEEQAAEPQPQPDAAERADFQVAIEHGGEEENQEGNGISFSELGRRIGGALLIPAISNRMGRLLLSLSKHSRLLRQFLALEPRHKSRLQFYPTLTETNARVLKGPLGPLWMFLRTFLYGIKPWPDLDPVWWRNSVGFGLFVVVSDCVQLYHQWLVKRDYDSRRVKNRNFAGIDISTLDLIPGRIRHAPKITRVGV